MGVDIQTYRARVGTFKFAFGTDVAVLECTVNFSGGLKTVGSVAFIGILLLIAGIESNPGPKENGSKLTIDEMLQKLGLEDRYPNKITIQDVSQIHWKDNAQTKQTFKDLPWTLLRRIIAVQFKARDDIMTNVTLDEHPELTTTQTLTNQSQNVLDLSHLIDETSEQETTRISPLDVFNVVMQCCDPMLKQVLFKKLYLCKIALPFMQVDWKTSKSSVLIWPLRTLTLDSKLVESETPTSPENEFLELAMRTIAFARFGRPEFSKSKMLNDLLSDQIHDTFFNVECPSGMSERYFTNNTIEMFCLPSVGADKDAFKDPVTVFNMRGNIQSDFQSDIIAFMAKVSDTLVLVLDKNYFMNNIEGAKSTVLNFRSVVLVITCPLERDDLKILQAFLRSVSNTNPEINLSISSSHKGRTKLNIKDMMSDLRQNIVKSLQKATSIPFEKRLSNSPTILTDEDNEICKSGKHIATEIVESIEKLDQKQQWKEVITPAHYIYSESLGKAVKNLYRSKEISETQKIETDIRSAKLKQLVNVSKPVNLFLKAIADGTNSSQRIHFMLGWLSYFLEKKKRNTLPALNHTNKTLWQKHAVEKSHSSPDSPKVKQLESQIDESHECIEKATIGIEHFFREMGHIYEAIITLDRKAEDFKLPPCADIYKAVATLILHGQPFELVDGDNFYMPTRWVQAILEQISKSTGKNQTLVLSVLGLQSSGKSTLLNSMFGSQFPVKSGRCTRGIHMQLLPICSYPDSTLPFDFVAVVDTEGLRAPELSKRRVNHDNEFATVITGVGDTTLLNIMGENTSEMRDILQVVVHAFIRLQLVKKTLDIGKSFYMVHQNVSDILAPENLRTGLQVLVETLDNVTKDSAEAEGVRDITTFNQIIKFDMNSNVWYLPSFWQGNPPMARVNVDYSDRLMNKKCALVEQTLLLAKKSFKSLTDIALNTHDLWKGVLTEDFVFSFRNSLEIKAYVTLEEIVKANLLEMEKQIDEKHIRLLQTKFSKCKEERQVQKAAEEISSEIRVCITDQESKAIEVMKTFFETNEYRETLDQWKEYTINRIKLYSREVEVNLENETNRLHKKTVVDIMTNESCKKHERELYDKSLAVAKELKGKDLRQDEINSIFEDTWKTIFSEISLVLREETNDKSMKDIFLKCLFEMFNTERMILRTELECHGLLSKDNAISNQTSFTPIEKLKGSFSVSTLKMEDLSLPREPQDEKKMDGNIKLFKEKVDFLFETLDLDIDRCCQCNDELTQRDVKKILQTTEQELKKLKAIKSDSDATFKITGEIKLCIHVCVFAQRRFDEHNTIYKESQGISARLQKFKCQIKEHFIGYINDRKAEETAAKQIILATEGIVRDKTQECIPNKVKETLQSSVTRLKHPLILEMLEDLVSKDNFDLFSKYIFHPKLYADDYLTKQSDLSLFGDAEKYSEVANKIVFEFYEEIRNNIRKSALLGNNTPVEEWIESFTKFRTFSVLNSTYESVYKVMTKVEDMKNFEMVLLESANASEERLKREFHTKDKRKVQWSGRNPYENLIQGAWGCAEQCPFCGEPCARSDSNHTGNNHYCLNHRPSCCKGIRKISDNKACITACNYDIQSDKTYRCDVADYICNAGKKSYCPKRSHSYQDYRTYFPNWDIEPNSNMEDCAKFWLWFVGKYKQQLAKKHSYLISHVPEWWSTIDPKEAVENLRNIFSPKTKGK